MAGESSLHNSECLADLHEGLMSGGPHSSENHVYSKSVESEYREQGCWETVVISRISCSLHRMLDSQTGKAATYSLIKDS